MQEGIPHRENRDLLEALLEERGIRVHLLLLPSFPDQSLFAVAAPFTDWWQCSLKGMLVAAVAAQEADPWRRSEIVGDRPRDTRGKRVTCKGILSYNNPLANVQLQALTHSTAQRSDVNSNANTSNVCQSEVGAQQLLSVMQYDRRHAPTQPANQLPSNEYILAVEKCGAYPSPCV